MTAVIAAMIAFLSTLSGGLFALKFRRYLRYILGLTAGVVLGVVAFDLLPEVFELVQESDLNPAGPMVAMVAGFLMFHAAEKLVSAHHAGEDDPPGHTHPTVGLLSATGLVAHSFLDGVGIGLAFQAGSGVGLAVTLAVIAHDFSDGLNTVSLMLVHGNKLSRTFIMMLAGAVAPILGAISTLWFRLPTPDLAVYLGFFAGFLLYISAGSILPEAHRQRFSWAIFGLTIFGAASIFIVTRFMI